MAMYKNIFVNEEYEGEAGAQVLGVNGEILVFGESAFATLEQATESADVANSIIKVTTGKYDTFYVADANGNVSVADQVVVVEFNGGDDLSYDNGEYSRTVTMEPATFTAEERAQIISALNDNNAASGTVYTTNAQGGNYSTIYVGSTNDFADLGDINGISETIDFGNLIKNDEAFVVVDKNTSVNDVIGSIEHETGHLKGESHPVTDGTIKDFLQEETDIRYLNGTTVTEAVDTEHRVMVGSLAKDSTTDVVGTMEKSEVTISADVNTAALWVGARYEDDIVDGKTATLNVTGAGTVVTAGDSELVENDKKIKNEGFIVRSSGIVNVTEGAEINVKWDAQTIIQGAVNVDGEGSKLTYEGSNPIKIYKDNAILTIKNGGELDFDGYEFQVGRSDGKQGKLVIESGATASIDADTNRTGFINHQNGLISVDGATLITNKLTNNGTVNVSGESTLNIAALTGNALNVVGTTTLTDSVVNGKVYAGYSNHHAADLTINGSFTAKALYVGDKWEHYTDGTTHTLAINTGAGKEMNVGSLYVRPTTTATITDSTVKTKDLFVRGVMNVSGSTLDANSSVAGGTGHWAVYEDDATDKTAALIVNNSKLLNSSDAKAINYLIIGSNSNSESAADSNAYASFTNSSVAVNTLYVQGSDTFANNYVELNNSTLTANKVFLHEDAIINVSGESTLNIAAATGKAIDFASGAIITSESGANFSDATHYIGGVTFGSGKFNFGGAAYVDGSDGDLALTSGAEIDIASSFGIWDGANASVAAGASLAASSLYWNGGDITVNGTLKAKAGNDGGLILNAADNTLTVNQGGKLDVSYVDIYKTTGNATVNIAGGEAVVGFKLSDGSGKFTWNITDGGSLDVQKHGIVMGNADSQINVNGGSLTATQVTNKGTFTVAGESTLNIAAVAAGSNDIELSEGTILKDSTIMGDVGVTGNVIFRGKNVLNNLYDFGEYGAYGNTDWAKWTVEAGSQLFLEQTVTGLGNNLYGVGYGDTVVINGELTDAAAAREDGLTKDDASFYSRTGVRFSSAAGWATSHFTVNNAYVILGTDGSFSNSASNGGSHEITFNNALVDAAQFYFSESTATFKITINDSDIKTAIFMTADKDSVYTLSGSKVVTTGTGTDRYNGNDGALTLTDSEIEVESGSYKNNGTIVMDAKSKLTAATLTGTGTITIDASEVTGDYVKVIELNGTASIENMVTVSGLKEGYSVVYGSDGDVILTTASANTLYVNSAYTGAVGSQVAGEAGKIIGYNAFSNITDAIKTAEQNGGATIDLGTESRPEIFGDVSSDPVLRANGTYTFTGGNYADLGAWIQTPKPSEADDVAINIVFNKANVVAGKFRLDNGTTLTITDSHIDARSYINDGRAWNTYYGDSKIIIKDSVVGYHAIKNSVGNSAAIKAGDKDTDYSGHNAGMVFAGSGVMTVENSTIFAYTGASNSYGALGVMDKGLMEFKNSAVYAYGFSVGFDGGYATVGRDNEVATMVLDNSVLRNINGDPTGNIFIGNANYAGTLVLKNGAKLYHELATMDIAQKGVVEIDDSAVAVKSITGNGKVIANGNVTLNVDNISAQVLVGGTYENGSRVYNEERSTLNLGSAAGKEMNITKEEFRVNNADITLNSDVKVALGGGHSYNFLYLRQSALDLNGHDLTMTKGKFLLTGLDITGQGTINLSGNDAFCVQTYASTIGEDVTFISAVPANIYEDLFVYGDMTVNGKSGQGPAIVGVHAVDREDGKITDTYTNGAVLTISGEGATYTQTGNTNMHIYGAASDELNAEIVEALGEEYRIGASSFVIENKAVADLTQAGTLTNDGNLIVSGATLNADKIVNNSTFDITGASTLIANSISGTGTIKFGKNEEKRSTINLGSATADAELTISADKILIANTDMSLQSDVTFNSANYPVFGNGSIDMNGNTMTISSTSLACIGNGAGGLTLKDGFVVANTNHFCMQCQGNVISADVELTVNGVGRTTSMFNTYGTTAIYGKVNVNHSIWGYDNIGSNAAGFEEPANELLISGSSASLNITRTDVSEGELRFIVTGGAAAGKLYVENGASFNLTTGRIENENLISVSNGAKFAADKLINKATGTVTIVDAAFTAGTVENNGSFYANANSTVTVTGNFTSTTDLTFNGNVTIGGTLTVDNLTLAAGSDVTVNNLVVKTELNLILGAALNITGTANLGNFNLTVKGNITASEYELVKGWNGEYDKEITFNGKKYTLDEAMDIYSNADDTSLSFVIENGTLILKDKAAQAAAGSVLIDPNLTLADGESIVIGGIRYTGGINAFKSADDIPAGKDITGVVLNNANADAGADVDEKLNSIALKDVQTVTVQGTRNTIDATVSGDTGYTLNVEAGSKLTGTGLFDVTGDMMINNDGHLDTNAKATGAMTIVNTSANTLRGTYTATDLKIDNQVSGAIEDATLNGTVSTAISGGTGTGVTVNTPHLSLNNTKFVIVDGTILSTVKTNNGGEADTGITLTGDTDLTISKAGEISTTIREAADNVGTTTLTTVGTQTYTGDIEVDKIIIGENVNTTLNGTVDFSDLELDGTLSIDMTSGNNYTGAGSVNGEGTLNLSHDGAWIVNDTVNRDFSGFTGTVNMTGAAPQQIVLGLGDAPNSTADSYFADGTKVNVAAGQKVFLAAKTKDTAIEFGKDGAINVGNLSVRISDGGTATLANNSNDFTQKLSGDNSKFTGTVNVSEGAQLTIANKLGATAINMNVEVAATGDTDDTQLNLDYEGLELAAKITGDTNDVINVKESATLKATGAIDAFSGKVNVTDNETLTLAGVNSTAAIFNGSASTTLDLDANTTLTADKALDGFSGKVDMTQETEVATSLTLNGVNSTAATFVGSTSDAINANADTTLTAAGAIDAFSGTVVMADNVVVTLNGGNTTAAKFNGDTTNTLDVNADTTLTADGAITDFSGTVDMIQDTEAATSLTISGANTTAATFKGAEGDVINVGTAGNTNTFSAAGAVNAFKGTINVAEGATLTLNGGNTTDAAINLGTDVVPNPTTLNLASTNVLNGAITGDADDVINVNGGKTTLNADNTGFTGIINLNGPSYTELVLNGNLSQANKGQINFNVNGAFLTSSGADVTIGSILVSGEGIVNEKFDVWGSKTTLFATGALDKFDGEVRIAETSNGVGTLTLLGDNTTAAMFVSINTNKKVEVVLKGADLTLTGDGALNDFWGKIQVADNTLTLDAENTTTALLYGGNDAKFVVNAETVLLGDQGLNYYPLITGNNAISNFAGTITVANGADLYVNSNNTTAAKFDGNGTAHFAGGSTNTLESDGALNNFTGKIDLSTDYKGTSTKDTLVLNGENTTSATFVAYGNDNLIVNANTTLTGEGALNKFSGTINMTQDTETAQILTLTQENTTAATLIGSAQDKLVVNADNTFSRDVSGFAGLYDIAADAELTLKGTFSNTIRANGDTLTLSGNAKNNATTTVTAESALNTLNIDDNDVTLAKGDFSNVYGEAGSKLSFTADFNDDALVDVKVGTVYITDTKDIVVTDEFAANVDMTINTAGATNTGADLTLSGKAADIAIGAVVLNKVNNIALSAAGKQNYYYLITGTGNAVSSDVESITIDGETVNVGQSLLHSNGNRYFLNIIEDGAMEHLVIVSKVGYSNYVTVNAAWTGKATGAEVTDAAGTVRNMNYDAAATLDAAIDSIRGNNNWNKTTEEGGELKGQAQIELDVTGDYAITTGKYLMDAANGVTDLLLNGRNGVDAVITSDIYGSDGNRVYKSSADEAGLEAVTSLKLQNVTTYGNIYGGGKLTIDNSMNANAWISGSTVAAGTNGVSTTHDTELVLAGGNFTTTFLTGGSWAFADSMTAADSKIVIKGGVSATGTILGGGYATKDKTLEQGDATVVIDANGGVISLAGTIYAAGGAATGGTLNVDNREVIFTGSSDNLAFTGTVSGKGQGKGTIHYNGSATVTFDDWSGVFKGSLTDFNTMVISGNTTLELARRQNKTGATTLTFDVGGRTNTTDAMYTVRDANRWEFKTTITVAVVDDLMERQAIDGKTYTLISNWNGGFTGFTITVDGKNLAVGSSVTLANGDIYTLGTGTDGKSLTLTVNTADITVPGTGTDVNGTSIYVADNSTTAALNIVGTGASSAADAKDVNIYVGKQASNVAKIAGVEGAGNYAGDIVIDANTAATFLHGVGTGAAAESVTINVGMANMVYNHIKAANTNGSITGNAVINVKDGADLSSGNQDILVGGIYSTSTTTIGGNTSITLGSVGGTGVKIGSASKFCNIVAGGGGTIVGDSTITVNAGEIFARSLIGGGSWEGTVSDSSVVINGGTITLATDEAKRAIYGGSYSSGMTTGTGLVTINGGTINGNIVGGNQTTAITSAEIEINGGTIARGNMFAVGLDSTAKAGSALVEINGGTIADGVVIDGQDDQITAGGTSKIAINGGNVNADVKDFNAIAMDVDAVLNGSMTGVESIEITGITDLKTDVAGAKTIIGSVDDVLASAKIDNVDAVLGSATKIFDASTTADTTDMDVWASLTKNSDGSLTVAWGRSEAEVGAALNAFNTNKSSLALGESLVADASGLADGDYKDCFQLDDKKSKGTLA